MLARKSKGFTLVEILVCIVIVVVLAAVGGPAWMESVQRSKGITCANNLRIYIAARDAYYVDNPQGPPAGTTAAQFVPMLAQYLPVGIVPSCPSGGVITVSPARSNVPACSFNGTKRELGFPEPWATNGMHDTGQ